MSRRRHTYLVLYGDRVLRIAHLLKNARRERDRYQGARIVRLDAKGEEISLRAARPTGGRFRVHATEVV